MKPTVPQCSCGHSGILYLFNGEGDYQAYGYARLDLPDMKPYEAFLEEFCQIVVD